MIYRFIENRLQGPGQERITGYALEGQMLVTWGDRLLAWNLPDVKARVLRQRLNHPLMESGCLLDVDGDGQLDLVINEGPAHPMLVWFRAPAWKRFFIDSGVDAADIVPAKLHGRRGVLLVHRRNQVRFYEIPADPTAPWPARDVYSFYTPSQEGGLLLADVNGDGITDILCGNYWIQSPHRFELPWRLFAINTWSETERSAMLRLKLADLFGTGKSQLVAVQREMPQARLAWFERPADPQQLWSEHRIETSLNLMQPHSLDLADFDAGGRPDIVLAERGGAGRLLILRNENARFTPHVIAEGRPIQFAQTFGRRNDILVIRQPSITILEKVSHNQ